MAFDGFLSLGGIELINAQRTRAYVENLLPAFPLVHRTNDYETINLALEQSDYTTPFLDGADWVDTDRTDNEKGGASALVHNYTHGFYGLYPLSITGIGDSTMSASVTEGILDGGSVGAERDASRNIRVRGLLIGESDASVESGLTWLRNALRANSCGMHGDSCGYSDLRYFLSPPDVCIPLYTDIPRAGETFNFGALTPATSPLFGKYGDGGKPLQPMSAEWLGQVESGGPNGEIYTSIDYTLLDGVVIRFGALEPRGSETIVEYGPYKILRTNRVINPRFALDTRGWVETFGKLNRIVGANGNSYGGGRLVIPGSPNSFRFNWAPDPSFENGDPVSNGWRSPQGVTAVADGTAPQGGSVAVVPATPGGSSLEVSLLGPIDGEVPGTISFWKKGDQDITVQVFTNLGAWAFTTVLTGLAAGWERVSALTVPMGAGYVMKLSTNGAQEIRVDGFLVEDAPVMGGFFSGDTPDEPGPELDYGFVGGLPSGASRLRVGLSGKISFETTQTNSIGREGIASFSMRSIYSEETVLAELLNEANEVVGSTVVQPSPSWQRFYVGTNNNLRTRLRFTSQGFEFDVDEVMIEAGSAINPYLDGDAAPESPAYDPANVKPGGRAGDGAYAVNWLGAPHLSETMQTWTGYTRIFLQRSFRPYLIVDQGVIPNVRYDNSFAAELYASEQIREIDRTYHRAYTTTGVQRIRDWKTTVGAATEVDFIITARPHSFSTQGQRSFQDYDFPPEFFSDEVVNLITTPLLTGSAAGITRYGGAGSGPTLDPGVATYVISSSATPSDTFGMLFPAFTVGVDLEPLTDYVFSAEIFGGVDTRLSIRGTGIATSAPNVTKVAGGGFEVRSTSFRTSNSGSVNLGVLNSDDIPAANIVVAIRKAMLTIGSRVFPYFDGSTPDTAAYDYSWLGAVQASKSRRAIPVNEVSLIVDPDLPILPRPPMAPAIPDLALEPQTDWTRYYIPIESYAVPLWATAIPTVTFKTKNQAIRQVRVRFHPNPFNYPINKIDPLGYCGEFLLSYLPRNSSLTVDGITQSAYASVAGGETVTANHLLYGTDGAPMDWPELSCGLQYVMTVDIPPGTDFDNLGFEVFTNIRE